jgi:hypothetical protein
MIRSSDTARGSGFMQRTMLWISSRGVKYCPAPFLPSLAAFSSKPSNASAFTSTSSAVHSVSSIRLTSRLRLTGLLKRDWAPAKMSPSSPGSRPSTRSVSWKRSVSSVPAWARSVGQSAPVGSATARSSAIFRNSR